MDDINTTQKLSEEVLKTDKISYDEVSTFEEKQVDECEDTFAKLDDEMRLLSTPQKPFKKHLIMKPTSPDRNGEPRDWYERLVSSCVHSRWKPCHYPPLHLADGGYHA